MKEPTMTEFERAAATLVSDWHYSLKNGESPDTPDLQRLEASIVGLLTSHARPAAGFVREATGPDRKVLGTLPVTADGCVIGDGAKVYRVSDNYRDGIGLYPITASMDAGEYDRPEVFAEPVAGAMLVKTLQATKDNQWCGTCNKPWHGHTSGKDCRCYSTPAAAQDERGEG